MSEHTLLTVISKVFHISWKEQGPEVVYLKGLAAEFAEDPSKGNTQNRHIQSYTHNY